MQNFKRYFSVALAYVGVVVGAGLSSGQDILQYFLSFGKRGIVAVIALGIMNVIFGRIIVTLGSYYQPDSHQDVLNEIAHPVVNKIIDIALIVSGFIIGFVMVAGAGANLHQQFGIPSWLGALICSVLIVVVAFMDFDKITKVLGTFTPIIILMLLAITAYTFIGKSYDWDMLDQIGKTITPAIANPVLAVINYYALCAITAVSMAFVLGGSLIRIGNAEKGGAIGGAIIGVIILCASLSLFVNLDTVKDADIPMLEIVREIHPMLAVIYALTIFALIFNTAFSLYYSTAKRFAAGNMNTHRKIMIVMTSVGYLCSFTGFKKLVSVMYPILGYVGIILLITLSSSWIKEKQNIMHEKSLRKTMIRILTKKYDENQEYTEQDKKRLHHLGEQSIADTETVHQGIEEYVNEKITNTKMSPDSNAKP